ncbi:MAG: glycosyltransferase [Candidatus Poribacteria bacterium]
MATLNAETHVAESVDAVMDQTCESWELLVMDGLSTDRTTDIIRGYNSSRIRLVEETDDGVAHAWDRAINVARGDYVLFLCASDVYTDAGWLEACVDVMDTDPEVSLVWGLSAISDEEGGAVGTHGLHPQEIARTQKRHWLPLWLTTGREFPDLTMCVARRVLRECMPAYRAGSGVIDALYAFNHSFNRSGYLPYGLPRTASSSRVHQGMLSMHPDVLRQRRWILIDYARRTRRYRQTLLRGAATHTFRNRQGSPLDEFTGLAGIPEHHFHTLMPSGERLDMLAGANLADWSKLHETDAADG